MNKQEFDKMTNAQRLAELQRIVAQGKEDALEMSRVLILLDAGVKTMPAESDFVALFKMKAKNKEATQKLAEAMLEVFEEFEASKVNVPVSPGIPTAEGTAPTAQAN